MTEPEVSDAEDIRASLSAAFDAEPEKPAATVEAEPVPAADAPVPDGQMRDPATGRFVAKPAESPEGQEPAKVTVEKPAQAAQPGQEQPKEQQAPATPVTAPPPGWSVAAKQAWDAIPPAVREAVAKRETEVNAGLSKLAEYKALEPFERLAAQSGTTVPQALERYIAAEQFLTREPIKGLLWLCQQYGVDPATLSGGKSEPGAAPAANGANGHQPPLRDPQIAELERKVNALNETLAGQSQSAVRSELATFAAKPEHRYYENVRVEMGALMQAGKAQTLDAAYEMACWANPEVRAALINERDVKAKETATNAAAEAASKAKTASKSVAGAPEGNSPATAPNRSLREEISAAMDG